jgi:hypothetical protein
MGLNWFNTHQSAEYQASNPTKETIFFCIVFLFEKKKSLKEKEKAGK